jgi:nitronate monooxygenase
MRLPDRITRRLRLPLIAAPMLAVSGVELVVAACRNGVIGAFPTANARSSAQLDQWLSEIHQRLFAAPEEAAPCCPNLIMRSPRLAEDLACLLAHRVEMVITSVGSPAPVGSALHGIGCLVLLSAGAGGQTGWLNPFAFVRALRAEYDGPLVLAGGISDGVALRAAGVLGADLAYMGTRFVASHESMAADAYKQMLVDSSADDVLLTKAFTGLATSMLLPSIRRAGLDPDRLDELVTPKTAAQMFGGAAQNDGPKRWSDIWSAGHSVSGVHSLQSVDALVAEVEHQYHHAIA